MLFRQVAVVLFHISLTILFVKNIIDDNSEFLSLHSLLFLRRFPALASS